MAAYNGFYQTNPKLSFLMTLALFSLAGIPPFAGMFSKFFVFMAGVQNGDPMAYAVVFIFKQDCPRCMYSRHRPLRRCKLHLRVDCCCRIVISIRFFIIKKNPDSSQWLSGFAFIVYLF